MNRDLILQGIAQVFEECPGNTILKENAVCDEIIGMNLFEKPLVGFGQAQDGLFEKYKEETVIGPWFMTPKEWMPTAKTVVSLFFPFTEEVKSSNRKMKDGPSVPWLYGRVEGQDYLNTYMAKLKEWLEENGIKGCVPGLDARFVKIVAGNNVKEYACANEQTFGSNWSERHAAYVCGLGTFGLSKGIITEKGMAGRFASVIIDVEIEPDERKYAGIYDYCTMCGACVRRCPAKAILKEEGKNHNICNEWLGKMSKINAPRYGCGLCQTKVPCESRIPKKI